MRSNSWLYEYYMVQSKLQYGLTYSGSQQNTPIPRITPYYHQHSPQTPGLHTPNIHPQDQSSILVTPPSSSDIPHPTPVLASDLRPSPSQGIRHPVEKLEPVDYSLHQSTPQYHVCPPSGRCFSSSSTGDDSLDTFTRQQIDDTGYVHQYRSIVTVTQYNPNTYPPENPDMYSYQLLGDQTPEHVLNHNPDLVYPSYSQKYLELNSESDSSRKHLHDGRYPKAKSKKLSSGKCHLTIT